MSRAVLLSLLLTLLFSCSDISSNDGSATEVGNPVIISSCYTSDSSLAEGAILTIASKEYNPLNATTGELHRLTLDNSGSGTIDSLADGEYSLTLYLKDSTEAAIHTMTISDTTELSLQTEKLSSFSLAVDDLSVPITLFVPGTDIVKTVTPINGAIVWDNFPVGMVPGIVMQEGNSVETVASSFNTASDKQVSLIATNDWYRVIKNKDDLDHFDFTGVYDITTMSTGQLWMSVGSGVYYNNYVPDLEKWAVYTTSNMSLDTPTILTNITKSKSDVIWLSGLGQVIRYEHGWNFFNPPADSLTEKQVTASAVVDEDLYLAYGEQLYRFYDNQYEAIPLGVSLSNNSVITSAVVVDSTLHFTTSKDGLLEWNMHNQSWKQFLPSDAGLTSDSLRAIEVLSDDTVWALSGAGLLQLSGGTFSPINGWSGQDDTLVDIAIDANGTLWILGTSMLYRYSAGVFTTYVAKDLQFTTVTIDNDRELIYMGHNEGLISKTF